MKILDESLIIITSNNGEEFLEHGCLEHGFQLYDETVRIPLIFYWKGHLDTQTKDTLVSVIDIAPTILDLCQLAVPPAMTGSNVFKKQGGEPVLFYTHFINQKQRGMRTEERKLIENVATGEIRIFDIAHDPGERNNLSP
jgi:arylsulfatase A-like enzyme